MTPALVDALAELLAERNGRKLEREPRAVPEAGIVRWEQSPVSHVWYGLQAAPRATQFPLAAKTIEHVLEIEARDLREGMYMQCGGLHDRHYHRMERCLGVTNGCAAWIVAPAEHPCTRTTITLMQSRIVTIRADAPAEKSECDERCVDVYCAGCAKPEWLTGPARADAIMGKELRVYDAKPPRPTIRIRAREMVPGMRVHTQSTADVIADVLTWHPVVATWRHHDGERIVLEHPDDWDATFLPLDELVDVQLPGPSPRGCCNCSSPTTMDLFDLYPRTAPPERHMRDRAPPERHMRDRAPPERHMRDCPVAPTDRHGGMRVWPVPYRGEPWEYYDGRHAWQAGDVIVYPSDILHAGHTGGTDWDDLVLQAFFLPPTPPEESGDRAAWERARKARGYR